LVTVADRFGVTVEQLRTWNHLTTNTVTVGKVLYVAEPVHLAPGSRGARRARAGATTVSNRGKAGAHTTTKTVGHSSAPSANTAKPATKSAHTTAKKTTTK
jgi:membrane-bound lytic murein transglycosylase D